LARSLAVICAAVACFVEPAIARTFAAAQFPSPAWCRTYPSVEGVAATQAFQQLEGEYLFGMPPCFQNSRPSLNKAPDPNDERPDANWLKQMISNLLSEHVTGLVTWIGTILTLIGLYITYQQAKEAAKAADAARYAVGKLEHRVVASNVSYANGQISTIGDLVANKDFLTAKTAFALTKRSLIQTCHLLAKLKYDDKHIVLIKRNSKIIDNQLTFAISSTHKESILINAIKGMSETLTELESKLTFP
jgi:hypothetical protein